MCLNYSLLGLEHKCSYRKYINKWVWLCSKIIYLQQKVDWIWTSKLEDRVKLLNMDKVVTYVRVSPTSSANLHFTLYSVTEVLLLPHMYHTYVLLFTCPSQPSSSS